MIQESISKGERVPVETKALNEQVIQIRAMLTNGCTRGDISLQEYADSLK